MSSLVARFPRVFVSELWLVSARPEHRVCPSCSWKPSSPSPSPGPAVPRFPASAPSLPPPLSLSHAGLHPSLLAVVHALSSALPSPSTWAHMHTQHMHTYICGRAHKHTHTHAHTQLTNPTGWVASNRHLFSHGLEAGSPSPRCWQVWLSVRASVLACRPSACRVPTWPFPAREQRIEE